MVFKELIFNTFYFGLGVVVFKEIQFLTVSILGRVQLLFKELIFNSFYFGLV